MVFASMQAECLFLRARAFDKQLQKFCEQEQASTHLIFASNSSKGQILRALFFLRVSLRSWRYCKRPRNKVLDKRAAKPRGEWGEGL